MTWALRAAVQPYMQLPSTSLGEVGALVMFAALGRSRARLSSIVRMDSQRHLITAVWLGKSSDFDDLAHLVLQRVDRVGGVDDVGGARDLAQRRGISRNGMNRSQPALQVAAVAGYFRPISEASKASSAAEAASSLTAVQIGFKPADTGWWSV